MSAHATKVTIFFLMLSISRTESYDHMFEKVQVTLASWNQGLFSVSKEEGQANLAVQLIGSQNRKKQMILIYFDLHILFFSFPAENDPPLNVALSATGTPTVRRSGTTTTTPLVTTGAAPLTWR